MNTLTDFINYELYPILFERIDMAFPEHQFRRYSGGWRSQTYLDGKPHKNRIDKVVINSQAPYCILEQGGNVKSLVNYVMERDRIDFTDAVKKLTDVAGLKLPKSEFEKSNYADKNAILEYCNNYFEYCLLNPTSKNAENIRNYLESRGYNINNIKKMELGYIPSQEKLFAELEYKKYDKESIDRVITIRHDGRIGTTHQLTIPYRSGGIIKGFKFRTTNNEIKPKYLNSKGLDRISGFFNISGLKGTKDLVIVEGELDALSASSSGINNVVAIGGNAINEEQVRDAIRRDTHNFTICFDRETAKIDETNKQINKSIKTILTTQEYNAYKHNIYVLILPDNTSNTDNISNIKVDPDSFIKENGIEAFKILINKALPYYEWQLNSVINKYIEIENTTGLTNKEYDKLLLEALDILSLISNPIYKEICKNLFLNHSIIKELGLNEKSLNETLDNLSIQKIQEIEQQKFQKTLSEASQFYNQGDIKNAINTLSKRLTEINQNNNSLYFSELLIPIQEQAIKKHLSSKPESLKTDYKIGNEELLLAAGAINIIAAPTSHGKTTFLINLFLNAIKNYPDKEFYFFSYEEDRETILINTLNVFLHNDNIYNIILQSNTSSTNNILISENSRKSLLNYYKMDSMEYIRQQSRKHFVNYKELFFQKLVDTKRLNIHYTSFNSDTLIEAIRYIKLKGNPGAIFIDYMQLLNLPTGKYKTYSRQEEIKEICIGLKDIAVETGLPLILGAQFNREVINPLRLHPTKIGEAGDIERIANLIIGFWNTNFKSEGTEGEKNEIKIKNWSEENALIVKILKNRIGQVGIEELLDFNGNTGIIKNKDIATVF